jgi:superfamily I DNA/RNA helicase/RecB family exonuclease
MLRPVATPKPMRSTFVFEPDECQRQAIEHVLGPMLVIAGAGTGKTTVLTRRIARLIRECGVRPQEILAVTYSENSAREMRERVQAELRGTEISSLQVTTFHAYCNNLLARCGKQFGVLDEKDLWIYLRKRIRDLHLNYFVRAAKVSQFLNDLLDFMHRCQDELVGPEKYAEYVARLGRNELPVPRVSKSKDAASLSDEEVLGRCREIANVFTTVERMLAEDNLGSFGHMITHAHALLDRDDELLARERVHARFILVDEFQDANFAQVKILQKLASSERNIFAVGDPDQAIYRFRGASSAAFGLFRHHFPGAKLVVLDKNRRSTTPVLRTAFAVISKNPNFQEEKDLTFPYQRAPLVSKRDEDAAREGKSSQRDPVETVILTAKENECFDLGKVIQEKRRRLRCEWKDFAILYRAHPHRDQVAVELAERQIPFSIENMDVMDMLEARDLFACLGAVVSPEDGASLFRVAALPQFDIDPEKLRAGMRKLSRDSEAPGLAAVLPQIPGGPAVLEELQQVRDEIVRTKAKSRAALEIIIQRFGFDRSSRPLAAVLEFVSNWEKKAITSTKEIAELLEYMDYFREAGGAIAMPSHEDNAVRLMTAHSAKGLEFPHVFILRASSPSFPGSFHETLVEFPRELRDPDSIAQDDGKELQLQEERRLFYVAMTRARDSLTIYARRGTGKKDSTPPGFLRDLLKDSQLTRWLRSRPAHAFQTDLFGEAVVPIEASRTSQWLLLAPGRDLSARLSASAVASYDICPLQFKLEREWRIPREAPAPMQYGATMHRVLRAYYDSVRFGRPYSEEALIELFRTDLGRARIQDRYQHDLYETQGVDQLRQFHSASQTAPIPEVLHAEEAFEVRIGNTTVVGRIDRIDRAADGSVVITDYKTGKPQSQEDADESLQLSVYALAAREKWGYRVDQLVFHNLLENVAVISRRTDAQLEGARLKVDDVAQNIAAGNFKAKPGFYCAFCPYRNLCPATEKRLYSIPTAKKVSNRNN